MGSVMIAGSGHGTLCDYAAQKIMPEIETLQTLGEIEQKITDILREIYTVQVPLHPVDNPRDADFDLLIAVKPAKWSVAVLYSTEGVTVVRRESYFVLGSGALTEYILDQMHRNEMSIEEGTSAALYMLQLAKRYIGGVGGDSKIVVLGNDGRFAEKPFWEISEEENLSRQYSLITGRLLLAAMRTRSGTDENFTGELHRFNEEIEQYRKKKKLSDELMDELKHRMADKEAEEDAAVKDLGAATGQRAASEKADDQQ